MKHNPQEPVNDIGAHIANESEDEAGPLAVDHPPLHIVTSTETLGFLAPLDSFWKLIPANPSDTFPEQLTCPCAEHRRFGSRWSGLKTSAPIDVFIHRCLFNEPNVVSIYRMGQCPACRTIFWAREESA